MEVSNYWLNIVLPINILMKERSSSVSEYEDEKLSKVDRTKAEIHGKNSVLLSSNSEYIQIWSSSTNELGVAGMGVELYFVFLKQMIILFFLISLVEIPVIVLNSTGGQIMDAESAGILEQTTLANQQTIPPYPILFTEGVSMLSKSFPEKLATIYIDLAASSLLIVLVIAFILYNERKIVQIRDAVCSPAKYAIEITGLSNMELKEEHLKDHFESLYGPVVECVFAKNIYSLLPDFKKLASIEANIKRERILCNEDSIHTSRTFDLDRKKYEEEKELIMAKLPKESKEGDNISRAYILFDNLQDKKRCLEELGENTWCDKRDRPLAKYRDRDLIIRQPCDPSDIQWENLDVSTCNRVLKDIIAISIATIVLIAAFAAIYATSYFQSTLPMSTSCGSNSPDELAQMANSGDEKDVYCYCASVSQVKYILIFPFRELTRGNYIMIFVQIINRLISITW
jgi:hypothetical protein